MSWCVWQCGMAIALAAMEPGTGGTTSSSATAQQQSARQMVVRAVVALGAPQARLAAARLRAEQSGTSFALEQSRLPGESVARAARIYRWHFDASAGRAIREAEQHFPGGVRFWTRAALTPAGGWSVDVQRWRSGTDLQVVSGPEALRTRLQWERFFPHLLLRQAEAAAAPEITGPSAFRFRDATGDVIEVELDPQTGLPISARQPGQGGAQTQLLYSDYRRRHGVTLPHRLQIKSGDRVVEELTLGATRLGPPREEEFSAPSGYSPPPPGGEPRQRELASGVFFFENMPFNNHSMAVDAGDHLILVEAPSSPEASAAQRRLLEQARPGKEVRYVLVTHHHGDHNGGLIPWAESGATIVVPAGARVAIERQLRGRGYQGPIRIEEVNGQRSFGTGANRIDAHAFSSSHAAAHMVMHLPERRILFQGDLFYLPERGDPPPAFPVVREFAALIARLGLEVDWTVGVHGRPAAPADLAESLRKAGR